MKLGAWIGMQPKVTVLFSYVYPDEDGDSVEAMLDMTSGYLTFNSEVPSDVGDPSVRTRIEVGESSQNFPVSYLPNKSPPNWRVAPEDLKFVSQILDRQFAESISTPSGGR